MKEKTMVVIVRQNIEKGVTETSIERVGDDLWKIVEIDVLRNTLDRVERIK